MPTPRSRPAQSSPSKKASSNADLNVLFIGNSFTARNDLPGMIGRLAEASGRKLTYRLISAGGASLRMHWNAGETAKALESGGYDYVVLQEQSTLPIKNAGRMHENVRLFDAAIKAAGSKTLLYMTWARQHAPESQRLITEAYESIGQEIGATVVPVGRAWARVLAEDAPPVLHDKDGSHQTVAGTYLAACAFFAVLYGEKPTGDEAIANAVSGRDRALLERVAWDETQQSAPPLPRTRGRGQG